MEESFKNHDKKKKIINKYNSTSFFYDKRYKVIQSEKYEIIFNKYRVKGKTVLDMGCGTGLLFEYFTKILFDKGIVRCNYVALDISWNMLLEFKTKIINLEKRINSPNLILSDIECLPFRDNIFHSNFSLTSFQNLPNIISGIKELYRVCKHNADFKFSILKKNLEVDKLLEILKPKIEDLTITEEEDLEDIVIQGKVLKVNIF